MARTALTLQMLPRAGAALATVAADPVDGNYFPLPSDGEALLSFFSPGGGTVTVYTNSSTDGLTLQNRVITLPPATVYLWICEGFPYAQPDNTVLLDFSGATSIGLYGI